MNTLTPPDVATWLKAVGLGEHEAAFLENDITGDILVHADHEMLRELGISSVGQRLLLLKAIAQQADDQCKHTPPGLVSPSAVTALRRTRPAPTSTTTDSVLEQLSKDVAKLTADMAQLRSELTPVWSLVKEYKQFQSKGEYRRPTSPQIETTQDGRSAISSLKSPKPGGKLSPDSSEFLSPKTPSSLSTSRNADPNVGTIKIFLDKLLNREGESYKSFRVSVSDPCSKILPSVLKKYKMTENWQNYALFIQYLGQERCLSFDERPLHLQIQIKDGDELPVFVLKHIKQLSLMGSTPLQGAGTSSQDAMPQPARSGRSPSISSNTKANRTRHDTTYQIPGQNASEPSPGSVVVAVYEYKADREGELDVAIGEKFIVVKREQGWLIVKRRDVRGGGVGAAAGAVPSGCVVELDEQEPGQGVPSADDHEKTPSYYPRLQRGEVLYDYKAGSPNETSVKKGEIVSIRKKIEHWLLVEIGDQRGWVPSAYVSARKELE